MKRKCSDEKFKFTFYTDDQLREHIRSQVDNAMFDRHCHEVAANLGIDANVVKQTLLDHSFQTLSVLQSRQIAKIKVRVNITGFFTFANGISNVFKSYRIIKQKLKS